MKKLILFLIFSLLVLSVIFSKNAFEKIEIENIDLQKVSDGVYIGEHKTGPVYVKVEVTVDDHKITEILILKHKQGKGKKAEKIVVDVVDKQSLQVDTITGATGSSKVILKAVEKALKKGMQ